MHPATALRLSRALEAEAHSNAQRRRLQAQRKRQQQSEPSQPRSWPLRILRLGNAGSQA